MPGSTAALPIQYRERTTTMFINRTTSRACGPRAPATHGDRGVEAVIAMRRLGVIVALGALLGMLAGVVTASPALADRGPKWQPPGGPPFTLPALYCGFKLRVAFPVNHEYTKVLHHADGSTTFLFTGAVTASYTNLQTGKTIAVPEDGAGKGTIGGGGSVPGVDTGGNGPFNLPPAGGKAFGLATRGLAGGRVGVPGPAPPRAITSLSLHGHVLVDVCA